MILKAIKGPEYAMLTCRSSLPCPLIRVKIIICMIHYLTLSRPQYCIFLIKREELISA